MTYGKHQIPRLLTTGEVLAKRGIVLRFYADGIPRAPRNRLIARERADAILRRVMPGE